MKEVRTKSGVVRRYRSPQEIQEILAQFKQSGSTKSDFAQQKGLNANVLSRWLAREQSETAAPLNEINEIALTEVPSGALASAVWAAEIGWPSGITLRLASHVPAGLVQQLCNHAQKAC